MNNDSKQPVKVNSKATNAVATVNIKEITSFEQAERFAEYIAASDTYREVFKSYVTEDGKTVEVVNKNDIVNCLLLGAELGFSPMKSIVLGKRLNRHAMIKVDKGRDLGLSVMSSLEHIHIFEAGKREIVYTGIHVVNKVLTDIGIKRDVIDDASKPFYVYKYATSTAAGEDFNYNDFEPERHVIINDGISAKALEEQLEAGKIGIQRIATRRGLVKLTRWANTPKEESVAIPYTLIQAVDAGLYPGIKKDGSESKGKDNWKSHPETHCIKMSIMLGARMIASDRLEGVYLAEEISFVKDTKDPATFTDEFEEV